MARGLAADAALRGDGTIPPLRHHRPLLIATAAAVAATLFCAVRSGPWWPLAGALGVAATAWLVRCALRRQPRLAWLGIAALGVAYAVALAGNLAPVDQWAAVYGALLLGVAELAHAAAGSPDLGVADPASRGRYVGAAAAALAAGFGVAALMLAAAGSGGTGGAEITALGGACAAAALALLATTARRAAS